MLAKEARRPGSRPPPSATDRHYVRLSSRLTTHVKQLQSLLAQLPLPLKKPTQNLSAGLPQHARHHLAAMVQPRVFQ